MVRPWLSSSFKKKAISSRLFFSSEWGEATVEAAFEAAEEAAEAAAAEAEVWEVVVVVDFDEIGGVDVVEDKERVVVWREAVEVEEDFLDVGDAEEDDNVIEGADMVEDDDNEWEEVERDPAEDKDVVRRDAAEFEVVRVLDDVAYINNNIKNIEGIDLSLQKNYWLTFGVTPRPYLLREGALAGGCICLDSGSWITILGRPAFLFGGCGVSSSSTKRFGAFRGLFTEGGLEGTLLLSSSIIFFL